MRYLVVLLLLAGCVKDGGWVRHGASDQEFMQDRGACISQAFQAPTPHQQSMIMAGCMQSKGWHWQEK